MEKFEAKEKVPESHLGLFRIIKNGFEALFEPGRKVTFKKNITSVLKETERHEVENGKSLEASSADKMKTLTVTSDVNGHSSIKFEYYTFRSDEGYFKYNLEVHTFIGESVSPDICWSELAAYELTPLNDVHEGGQPRKMLIDSFSMSEAGSSFGGVDMGKYAAEAAALAPELRPKIEVIGIERQQ